MVEQARRRAVKREVVVGLRRRRLCGSLAALVIALKSTRLLTSEHPELTSSEETHNHLVKAGFVGRCYRQRLSQEEEVVVAAALPKPVEEAAAAGGILSVLWPFGGARPKEV